MVRSPVTGVVQFVRRKTCPVCEIRAGEILYRCGFTSEPLGSFLQRYYGRSDIPVGTFQIERCGVCSLYFQRFVGTDDLLRRVYSQWITYGIDDAYRLQLANPPASRDGHEMMALAAFLDRPKLKVLDYGTGWALWPMIAARLGHQAYATELAPEKAEWAVRNGVTILTDDEIGEHSFDVINLEQTLEHMIEPAALLKLLVPSLGGVLKIAVPDARRVPRIVRDLKGGDTSSIVPIQPIEHVNGFTSESLLALTRSFGLHEVRPSMRQRFAFLFSGMPRSPKLAAKEMIRPFWSWRSRSNLYRWFVSSGQAPPSP